MKENEHDRDGFLKGLLQKAEMPSPSPEFAGRVMEQVYVHAARQAAPADGERRLWIIFLGVLALLGGGVIILLWPQVRELFPGSLFHGSLSGWLRTVFLQAGVLLSQLRLSPILMASLLAILLFGGLEPLLKRQVRHSRLWAW